MTEFNLEKLMEAIDGWYEKEDTKKETRKSTLIETGFSEKAINSSEDGSTLFASVWSTLDLPDEYVAEIERVSYPHSDDENVRLIYVWADNHEDACERIDDENSSFTGEVREDGRVYIDYLGEWC
jgi:hypothetical protein